jgi:hypothetical protein
VDISNLAAGPSIQSLLATPTTTASPPTSSATSPAVEAASLIASSESQLFGSISGGSTGLPDLSGLTAAAQAYSLYTNPAMLQQLATGAPPATAAATSSTGAVFTPPAYSFNPFDQASWWTDPSSTGTTVDASL